MLLTAPPGFLYPNVAIPDLTNGGFHPQLTDIYVPPNLPSGAPGYLSATVFLHGGSGTKENFARNLLVTFSLQPSLFTVNWAMLIGWKMIAVFPQGQACTGITNPWNPRGVDTRNSQNNFLGVPTWTNRAMYSQADDVAFLKDLSSYITTTFGHVAKNLFGHSNGGMMVNRMWYEAPNQYKHYGVCSGPASSYYITNSALPANNPPFWGQFGAIDSVLDLSDGPAGAGSTTVGGPYGAGTSTITLGGVGNIANGSWLMLPLDNGTLKMVQVTGITSNNVSFTPAIPAGRSVPGNKRVYLSHFFDRQWEQNPSQFSVADVSSPNPTFWSGESYQTAIRANALGDPSAGSQIPLSDGVVTNIKIGTQTTWTYASGQVVLQLLSNADHNIATHEQCTGRRLTGDFFNWIKSLP